jgi:hypothetical protein
MEANVCATRELYLEDERPWLVEFSGGKHSTMLASLIFDTILSTPADVALSHISSLRTDSAATGLCGGSVLHACSNPSHRPESLFTTAVALNPPTNIITTPALNAPTPPHLRREVLKSAAPLLIQEGRRGSAGVVTGNARQGGYRPTKRWGGYRTSFHPTPV